MNALNRRDFISLSGLVSVAAVTGCATNPVTGKREFMLYTEAMDVDFDRKWAPQQFSADYGASQDENINAYVSSLGSDMAVYTHRPAMPYNIRVVNSVVVNGYTMPAGSIGLTRGLMLELDNEAQIAAVIGHEYGHVNRRHAASRMSKSLAVNLIVAGGAAYLDHRKKEYAAIAAGLGMIGANALLFKYSRDDEREADSDGMEYMARAGHNTLGMSQVMEKFMKLNKHKPSTVDVLFSTHPLSQERYDTAVAGSHEHYAELESLPLNRERYMDNTSRLRSISKAIIEMQNGENSMMKQNYNEAEQHFSAALQVAPNDYAGLLMMSKCLVASGKNSMAGNYIKKAKDIYPEEVQAVHLSGMFQMKQGNFSSALSEFTAYEQRLPGNPNTIFYQGLCLEKQGDSKAAAREYMRYRKIASNGEFAPYTESKLVKWGYVAPPQQNRSN